MVVKMVTLKDKYRKEVAPALVKKFGTGNVMQAPKVSRVVLNMGLGVATPNPTNLDS